MKRKTAIAFMSVGALLVFFAVALFVYNSNENKKARESSETVMESMRTIISQNELDGTEKDPFDKEMTVKEIDGYGYIGYLSVPVLGIDLPVMSEWDYDRLKISPCRYYGSTGTDNLVIAAHNYKVHFGYLGNLKAEDTVVFTDMDGAVYSYKVDYVEIIAATDVDKVKDSGDDLILYTCTYGGSKRIAVRCSYAD